MAGFLYFIPNATAVNESAVRSLALAGLDPKHYRQGQVDDGPGGTSGVMLNQSADEIRIGYRPDAQTWYPHRTADDGPVDYWLGMENDRRPGPDDLARDTIIPGYGVQLADGAEWHCPIARYHGIDIPPDTLPQSYGLDDAGRPAKVVVGRYAALWDMATEAWKKVVAEMQRANDQADPDGEPVAVQLTFDDMFGIAVDALAANYMIGEMEVRALGILTTANTALVIRALVDLNSLAALGDDMGIEVEESDHADAKKNESANEPDE